MPPKDADFSEKPHGSRPRAWGYLGRMLLPDEHVVLVARLHWIVYASSVIGTALGVALLNHGYLLANAFLGPEAAAYTELPVKVMAIFIIAVGVMYIFFISISFVSTDFVVTNQRVIHKRGLLAPSIVEASITKISSVDIEQSVLGRLLDYGKITVRASGQDIAPVNHVADPFSYYYQVMRAARLEVHPETGKAVQAGEPAAEISSPPAEKLSGPAQRGDYASAHEGDEDDDD